MMVRSSSLLIASVATLFLAFPVQGMRCQQTTIRHYVNCADACFTFTAADALARINKCQDKRRFGCVLNPCSAGFECAHDPNHAFPLCGNDQTVFDGIDIDSASDSRNPLQFMVDVNAPPLKVQYYFLVDTSKSMTPHIHDVKKKIKDLVDLYDTMPEVDATFALGEYRDPGYGGSPANKDNGQCGLRLLQSFTKERQWIKKEVDGLTTSTTEGSGPEGLLPSVAQAATHSGWSAGARKILVVFGDAPGYEPTKHDVWWLVKYPSFPFTIDRTHVGNLLKEHDIVYLGVSLGTLGLDGATTSYNGTSAGTDSTAAGQSTFLATQTSGIVTSISTTLMQAVIDAKESYEREYTMDTSSCSSRLVINDGKEFKVRLKPSESSTVDMTMYLNDPFCDPFDCDIKYFEDGIELVPLNMNFLEITGCPPIRI